MQFSWKAAACCVLAVSGCSSSKSQIADSPASIEVLVTRFVAATNARDANGLNALLHPKSLACVTPENKDFYDRSLAVSFREPIPPGYHFTDALLAEKGKMPLEGYGDFPVRPTHEIHIEYSNGAEDSGIVIFWLVQENGHWYKDDPCIRAEAVKQFHDDLPDIKARESATAALVDQIPDSLLSELKSLIRAGKTSTASRRYAEATGKDGSTSLFVIAELEERLRQIPK
jgi:hypothetical protein